MEIKNKKATFNYYVESEIEAGIALVGTEIKSIRQGRANITDSYIRIKNNEVFIINMFIDKYDEGSLFNHEPTRERKLLLHKNEIKKLFTKVIQGGYTLIPTKLYFKNGMVKLMIGLAKGKKVYDKRETIKKRDIERSIRYRR